jgi:hypothetical protein
MWQQSECLARIQADTELTVWVIQITEYAYTVHASSNAGRLLTFCNVFITKTTFFDDAFFVGLPHIIWAGSHAHLAANTFLGIDQDHAIRAFVRRIGGAYALAGRVVTVHTLHRIDFLFGFGVSSFFAKF